jgi:hypothetical protein
MARIGNSRRTGNAVLCEESERPIQPRLAPPLPAKTVTLTNPPQMVPNLLFDPVANVREASARMPDRKVLHPAPQHRVDFRNHLADGPGPMAAENVLERAQQRRRSRSRSTRRGLGGPRTEYVQPTHGAHAEGGFVALAVDQPRETVAGPRSRSVRASSERETLFAWSAMGTSGW